MNNDPQPFTVTSQPRKQGNISAFSPFMILVTTFDVALRFRPPMCKKCLEKSPLYIKFNAAFSIFLFFSKPGGGPLSLTNVILSTVPVSDRSSLVASFLLTNDFLCILTRHY